jgi:AcrR family transcriptional regulator
LSIATRPTLDPRKTPVQARSAVTVESILDAAIQVLLACGKERLTTTLVARRAGVSVGTLYQYFPNKTAILQACLRRHMQEVCRAILETCQRYEASGLLEMGTALCHAYLAAKMRSVKSSAALYSISNDVEGAAISKAASTHMLHAIARLFATAREGLSKDPETVAAVVVSAINGIFRRVLESEVPDRAVGVLQDELIVLVCAYLRTCLRSPAL